MIEVCWLLSWVLFCLLSSSVLCRNVLYNITLEVAASLLIDSVPWYHGNERIRNYASRSKQFTYVTKAGLTTLSPAKNQEMLLCNSLYVVNRSNKFVKEQVDFYTWYIWSSLRVFLFPLLKYKQTKKQSSEISLAQYVTFEEGAGKVKLAWHNTSPLKKGPVKWN